MIHVLECVDECKRFYFQNLKDCEIVQEFLCSNDGMEQEQSELYKILVNRYSDYIGSKISYYTIDFEEILPDKKLLCSYCKSEWNNTIYCQNCGYEMIY